MGITLLRGRAFDSSDRGNTQEVAVVNQALAERYFPYQDPIGQHIKLSTPESKKPWLTIIGVVGNVKTTTVFQEMGYVKPPAVYRPLEQQPLASMALLVRTQVDPDLLGNPVERVVRSLDDQVTVSNLKPMDDRLYALRAEPRFRTVLLGAFAALALLLAALGIYGLLMQSVIRRTKEIGIRMALGASRGNVIRGVLRQAITTVSAGIVLGLLTTAFLVRFINRLLYEVRPGNPLVLGGVSALLILIAMAASYVPARRATGIDPLQALRTE
jgi:putative ABC transport system permease protein